MKPFVNLQEKIGKTVGRRQGMNPHSMSGQTKADMRAWHAAVGKPFVPKGVFRFKTHAEADEWMLKMMARPSKARG